MNIQRRDTANAVDSLSSELDSLESATIDDISSYFKDVLSAFGNLEHEVGYLISEHEELEDELEEWRGLKPYFDIDDAREMVDNYDDLIELFGSVDEAQEAAAKADIVTMYFPGEDADDLSSTFEYLKECEEKVKTSSPKIEALKNHNAAQARIISALVERLKQLNDLTAATEIGDLIFTSAQPDALPLLTEPDDA